MKKLIMLFIAAAATFGLSLPVSASTIFSTARPGSDQMFVALMILLAAAIIMLIISIAVTCSRPFSRRNRGAIGPFAAIIIYLAALLQIALLLVSFRIYTNDVSNPVAPIETEASASGESAAENTTVAPTTEETVPPTTEDPRLSFAPVRTEENNPENMSVNWEILVDGEVVDSYTREEPISLGDPEEYFALPGVATFRGNNYRNNPVYGTAEISSGSVTRIWKHNIGRYNQWGGCAWTGQPLVVQWDAETKAIMNLYDSKKEKEGLVEVIYGTLDGNIHFYDLEDGTETRDPIFMSMNFKGAGALDPRGYPILYIGGGLYVGGYGPRMYAVSLIDGTILWEYGNNDSDALRNWTAFDSSPIVDAETDTLIWPGESGVLYTVKLNTAYDKESGTLSMNPDTPVKTRYSSTYSEEGRYLGYECSAVVVNNYYYVGDNAGLFHCVDLNTMELIWTQDVKDDVNSTPVFEWDADGNGYLYVTPSLDYSAEGSTGTISIYKLDASTGEILWEHPLECVTIDDISGGALSSPVLGKEGSDIENLIIYSIGRTPSAWKGMLIAMDKETGEVVWETETGNYAWSSPIALYNEEGKSFIFTANASGVCRMIDGVTGEVLTMIDLDQTVEASPVAFGNMMVLGSREAVYGFKIS